MTPNKYRVIGLVLSVLSTLALFAVCVVLGITLLSFVFDDPSMRQNSGMICAFLLMGALIANLFSTIFNQLSKGASAAKHDYNRTNN